MNSLARLVFAPAAAVVIACGVPALASATPSSGVTAVTLAEGDIPAGLLPFVPDGVHVVVREITIAPGGTTGWHYHDGNLVGLVRSGTLTHPGADCVPVVYRTGDIIKEPKGQANTHVGRNLGSVPVVLDVLYLIPLSKPLFEDAPAPGCDKQGR
ncbi:cupin domain-containing protein [Gordonia sp. ABSL49_1]|uniref:cupin domain-containing protein n=1 Tax=unclassified Gordonia (in: high G+C Gram-positive bacteria) TaxID=2657482 RepID=UPI001F0DCECE|nr:cupin domain-containing protein [Gordonia sp. ABSL49_1]MCH5641171.1 cupin domain-containing protein [Gordonia sp. ABSL49_1]